MIEKCGDSLTVKHPLQGEDGGSNPTSPLHNYRCIPVHRYTIQGFIEKWHYSGSINGVKSQYCFGLYDGSTLIGAAILAAPATGGVSESYAPDNPNGVIELRRLCLIDETPPNAESYFIGKIVKWLVRNTEISLILSYADLAYGHTGVIYRASNFQYRGQSPAIKTLLWNGKRYHDRALRVKYKGEFKPFSLRLRAAVAAGEAVWVEGRPKNIYVYIIPRKEKRSRTVRKQESA